MTLKDERIRCISDLLIGIIFLVLGFPIGFISLLKIIFAIYKDGKDLFSVFITKLIVFAYNNIPGVSMVGHYVSDVAAPPPLTNIISPSLVIGVGLIILSINLINRGIERDNTIRRVLKNAHEEELAEDRRPSNRQNIGNIVAGHTVNIQQQITKESGKTSNSWIIPILVASITAAGAIVAALLHKS
ncbi:MAG: hypothetical protein ACRYG8_26360 [Janthinobacterium lividum]